MANLSVAPVSPNAGRVKSSSHRSYAKKVLRLVDRRLQALEVSAQQPSLRFS